MEQREQPTDFEAVKARLEEIARAVDDENLPLDEALDLYEEAVKLGLQASDLLETGIVVEEEPEPEPSESSVESPDNRRGDLRASGTPQAGDGTAATSAFAADPALPSD